MDAVSVVFTRKRAIGTVILRAFLWSRWSHCALLTEAGTVIEAVASDGVREVPLAQAMHNVSKYEIRTFPVHDAAAIIAAARSEIGKKYDWMGVLGIAHRMRWQADSRWFCSELIAWAFEQGGTPLFRTDTYRITPRDLDIPLFGAPLPLES